MQVGHRAAVLAQHGLRLSELRGGLFVLALVVEQAPAHELRHRQRGIGGVRGLGMTRRRLGVLVRERDARGHLVRRRERAHVLVLGQRNRHVGLLARGIAVRPARISASARASAPAAASGRSSRTVSKA